jgi:hypothetical protein
MDGGIGGGGPQPFRRRKIRVIVLKGVSRVVHGAIAAPEARCKRFRRSGSVAPVTKWKRSRPVPPERQRRLSYQVEAISAPFSSSFSRCRVGEVVPGGRASNAKKPASAISRSGCFAPSTVKSRTT